MSSGAETEAEIVAKYLEARKESRVMQVANHPGQPKIISTRPIPVEARGGLRKFDHFYPFESMNTGDSFWVPSPTGCTPGAVAKFAKKSEWKFVTRAQAEDGTPNSKISGVRARGKKRGTRVWRIA